MKFFVWMILISCASAHFKPTSKLNEDTTIEGQVAQDGQAPFQASIRTSNYFYCAGVIIHPEWVLTSAQCIKS